MDLSGSSLIVVADGRRARLFEERRRGGPLIEVTDQLGDLSLHTAGAAATGGRAHDRRGPASHMGDSQTPKDRREEDFIDLVGARAAQIMRREGHQDLVIFAAPRALGRLRQVMTHVGVPVALAEASDRVSADIKSVRASLRDLRLGA